MEVLKRPVGRPPAGAVLDDGRWILTQESLAIAAARVEKHRTDCRERYRRMREILKEQRPDMFAKRARKAKAQTTLEIPADE